MLWLVKNGVPWDVANNLDKSFRDGFCIIFSEIEGQKFNWNLMRFEEKN